MHSNIAERILCLVTSPAHAATIIGDLVETAGPHGRRRFWQCVIQTASALLWRELCTDPAGSALHAFLGMLRLRFITLIGGAAVVTLWIGASSRLDPGAYVYSFPLWGYRTLAVAVATLLPFYIGRTTARESKRSELVSALYLIAVIFMSYGLFEALSELQMDRIGQPIPGRKYALLLSISEALFVLAGALSSRKTSTISPTANT